MVRRQFDFGLRNQSKSTVNHLSLTFCDSTIPVLEDALASGNLAEDERVELEHFLFDRPAFLWLSAPQPPYVISADRTAKIQIQVHGKRGLTKGTVYISYGNETTAKFGLHQRRIEFTLAVTVNASLEVITCDFMPYQFDNGLSNSEVQNLPHAGKECFLLALEMRNAWTQALTLELKILACDGDSRTESRPFLVGQARRIVLALPRHHLPSDRTKNPLPGRKKAQQFVLPMPSSQITAQREAWWYRQYILESLSGTWRESTGDRRSGFVEMRGLRLSERHVRVIQRQALEASVEVTPVRPSIALDPCHHVKIHLRNCQGDLPSNRTTNIQPALSIVALDSLSCRLTIPTWSLNLCVLMV